jgi:hypothetical protein
MASESDLNPIGNLIRNLFRILERFQLKILNRKMASESDLNLDLHLNLDSVFLFQVTAVQVSTALSAKPLPQPSPAQWATSALNRLHHLSSAPVANTRTRQAGQAVRSAQQAISVITAEELW